MNRRADWLDDSALISQIRDWLDVFAGTEDQVEAKEARPAVAFADWCCIPLVALVVIGDILFQFLRG